MKKTVRRRQHRTPRKPVGPAQNLTADEALALTHTPGAVRLMKRLARLLLAGHTLTSAASRLRRNYRYLMTVTQLPEFKAYLAQLETDYFAALDKKIKRLLHAGVDALFTQLRSKDWRAVDAAIEKIFRLHGRYIDKIDLTHRVQHDGTVQHAHEHQLQFDDGMPYELRTKAREFLALTRQLREPRALPDRFTDQSITNGNNDHAPA
jgi:hypothetical protein